MSLYLLNFLCIVFITNSIPKHHKFFKSPCKKFRSTAYQFKLHKDVSLELCDWLKSGLVCLTCTAVTLKSSLITIKRTPFTTLAFLVSCTHVFIFLTTPLFRWSTSFNSFLRKGAREVNFLRPCSLQISFTLSLI